MDVRVAASALVVTGTVAVGAGSLLLGEDAVVGGTLRAGTASARLAGRVDGDAALGAGSIVLEPTATIGGDLRYDGDRRGIGRARRVPRRRPNRPLDPVGPVVVGVYGFLVNLVLGAILLFAFRRLATQVVDAPLASVLLGLVGLVAVPLALVFVRVTVIGIPWPSSARLLFALVVVALATRIPGVGRVVQFAVLVLGLGGIVALALNGYRRRRGEAPRDRSSTGTTTTLKRPPAQRPLVRVTLEVVGDEEHVFDVEAATYAELLAEVGLSTNEVAVLVDGRPVPEDQPAKPGRARVLRLVSGGS